MKNSTFKALIVAVAIVYGVMLFTAITDDRKAFALLFACGVFVCLGLLLVALEPKKRKKYEEDPYWESSRKQAEKKTKEFIVKARRKSFKIVKDDKK